MAASGVLGPGDSEDCAYFLGLALEAGCLDPLEASGEFNRASGSVKRGQDAATGRVVAGEEGCGGRDVEVVVVGTREENR